MGCDIHPYFERKTENGWEPLWRPYAHPEHWYDTIMDEHLKNGAASLLSFSNDEEDQIEALKAYYKSLNQDQIIEKYGDHTCLELRWREHGYDEVGEFVGVHDIKNRDYIWFGNLAGVRGGRAIWPVRGFPDDASRLVKQACAYWGGYGHTGGEGHTHSWLIVEEMIARPSVDHLAQIKWLKRYITDPKNTRMVFWFDC